MSMIVLHPSGNTISPCQGKSAREERSCDATAPTVGPRGPCLGYHTKPPIASRSSASPLVSRFFTSSRVGLSCSKRLNSRRSCKIGEQRKKAAQ